MRAPACIWPILAVLLFGSGLARGGNISLPPCPDSPNCVSSQAPDPARQVAPLQPANNRQDSIDRLRSVVTELPRTSWQQTAEDRAEATFTSALFRFVDDVSFYFHEDGRVDVRSASRVGHWDLGANRRRVEQLRQRLNGLN